MQIIINTIQGTYLVPSEKQSELIFWLQRNAVKVGQEPIREHSQHGTQNYSGTQLINENNAGGCV